MPPPGHTGIQWTAGAAALGMLALAWALALQ
jgi:hypothetical protein